MNPFRDVSSGALQAIGGAIALAVLAGLAYYTKPVREGLAGWWTSSVSLEKGTLTILILLSCALVFAAYMIGRDSYRKLMSRFAFEELTFIEKCEIAFLRGEDPFRWRRNKAKNEKNSVTLDPK